MLTRNQHLILTTLGEIKLDPDEIETHTTIHQLANAINTRHNRWLNYDQLQSTMRSLTTRGLVKRNNKRPAGYAINAAGTKALAKENAPA